MNSRCVTLQWTVARAHLIRRNERQNAYYLFEHLDIDGDQRIYGWELARFFPSVSGLFARRRYKIRIFLRSIIACSDIIPKCFVSGYCSRQNLSNCACVECSFSRYDKGPHVFGAVTSSSRSRKIGNCLCSFYSVGTIYSRRPFSSPMFALLA